jgi:hypothetical protein
MSAGPSLDEFAKPVFFVFVQIAGGRFKDGEVWGFITSILRSNKKFLLVNSKRKYF